MPRPTVVDVEMALEVISLRVPDRHVTPDAVMAGAWQPDLTQFDRSAVFAAARAWNGLRFPSVDEFRALVRDHAIAIANTEAAKYSSGELSLNVCPDGCDHGWLSSTATNSAGKDHEVLTPCERCLPVKYAVWRHRTQPGHDDDRCTDCAQIRKGKENPSWLNAAKMAAARPPHARNEPASEDREF